MDNPQYKYTVGLYRDGYKGFKPYYKWITLNTDMMSTL